VSEGKTHPDYLPTLPGTYMEFSAEKRVRPCWRCRFHLRWPPWQPHWGCGKPVEIKEYV
jgi:hypothetical protein